MSLVTNSMPSDRTDTLGRAEAFSGQADVADYFALLKPRVMSLVVFTALVGLVRAPSALHPVLAFTALLCIAIGAGAAGALNMWWDADIDAQDDAHARPADPRRGGSSRAKRSPSGWCWRRARS